MTDPTQYLPTHEGPLALLVLFASSVIEYLFPPFPGDTVTLFGAFLVTARGWSFAAVLIVTTLGSGLGAMLDFGLGRVVARRRHRAGWGQATLHRHEPKLEWLAERFRRYGAWFILANRFLPGVRAFFFLAAGLAGMKPGVVLVLSLLSALLWNLLIMLAGVTLGASWPSLLQLFDSYARAVWALLALLALGLLARGLTQWRRRRRALRTANPPTTT